LACRSRGPETQIYSIENSDPSLIAILENHQQPDGPINIPQALQPLTGKERIEPKFRPVDGLQPSLCAVV
jgi:hypothetical protein